jgi:transcription elongation GreA/GreB family factor
MVDVQYSRRPARQQAAHGEDAGLLELQEEQQRLERRAIHVERLLTAARESIPAATGVVARGSHVEIKEDGERTANAVSTQSAAACRCTTATRPHGASVARTDKPPFRPS